MKKTYSFRFAIAMYAALILFSVSATSLAAPKEKQQYFEIKIYRLKDPGKSVVFDNFFKNSFIPAMHRAGVSTVGVFKPVEADTSFGKMYYVLVSYKSSQQYFDVVTKLENDSQYLQSGKDFLDAQYNDPPFIRYESVFLKAFSLMPQMKVYSYTTPRSERIYELRSYESWTEAKATKKIEMFNAGGEMKIFEKVGSNAVFYGQVLLGSLKPRLMYMTTYADMKSHDEHWKAFSSSPEWKALSSNPEYANTVIKAKAYLLHPTDYSDF